MGFPRIEPPRPATSERSAAQGCVSPKHGFCSRESRHTAWDRAGGLANRSGAGDLDVVIYSARKWARLALAGNPTVLLMLFTPDGEVVHRDEHGAELVENAHRFVSRLAADRFLGYLRAQRGGMVGGSGAHTNRLELVAEHGYDTKFAMHALRLGAQGVELLTTGQITLPVPDPAGTYLRAVRRGQVPLAHVVAALDDVEAELVRLQTQADVPPEPGQAVGGRLATPLPPVVLVDARPGRGETTLTHCCRQFILFSD